ncbi:hypothetical protein E4P39_00900 [Blastococcus sp. CT_GayMR19]|uniref:hypothetical protein n=1 Tax=Blastococcus sp. CT_GayMR19 TaxID=2559608 RepID=UPI0010744E48|nr:hypothetical protein [Blastococcus sp. CT_GayMR19]TFV79253.1 hypothetical protein E4P39_00900 [Blastococcus sp. CT_GayMR19]
MTERPTGESSRLWPLVAGAVALVVVVLVLDNVFGMGLVESGLVLLVLLPLLASVVMALAFYAWAKRRGDL